MKINLLHGKTIISGLIPQSLQPQTQVKLLRLGWCHKPGECAD